MKALALALPLLAFAPQSMEGPALKPDPAYPLHIRILRTHGADTRKGDHGHGVADILPQDTTPAVGLDYTYECSTNPIASTRAEFYQARWKKPNAKLEILLQRPGSDKTDRCELDVVVKSRPFTNYGTPPQPIQ